MEHKQTPPQNVHSSGTSELEYKEDLDLLPELPHPLIRSPSPVASNKQESAPAPAPDVVVESEPFVSLSASAQKLVKKEEESRKENTTTQVDESTCIVPVAQYPTSSVEVADTASAIANSSGLYRLAPPHIAGPSESTSAAAAVAAESQISRQQQQQQLAASLALQQLYYQVHGRPSLFRHPAVGVPIQAHPQAQLQHRIHPGQSLQQQQQPSQQQQQQSLQPYPSHYQNLPNLLGHPSSAAYPLRLGSGQTHNTLGYTSTSSCWPNHHLLAHKPGARPYQPYNNNMDSDNLDRSPLGDPVPMAMEGENPPPLPGTDAADAATADATAQVAAAAAAAPQPPAGKFFAVRAASTSNQEAGAVFLSYADAQKHIADNYNFVGAQYLLRGFNDLGDAARFASEGEVNVMTLEGAPRMPHHSANNDGASRKRAAAAAAAANDDDEGGAAGSGSGSRSSKKKKEKRKRVETQPRKPYKQWEAQFVCLQQHHATTGNFLVTGEDDASRKLRRWISDQRTEYRALQAGDTSKMTQEKIDRLTSIGFDFTGMNTNAGTDGVAFPTFAPDGSVIASPAAPAPPVRSNYKPRKEWQEMYAKLLAYKEVHGTTIVPRDDKVNQELRLWMNEQNMAYRHLKEGRAIKSNSVGRLTDEKKRLLEEAGHEFVHYTFDERIQQLKKFKEDNDGSVAVPMDHALLGKWAAKMRDKYRKYQDGQRVPGITAAQVEKLTAIGFTSTKRKMVNKGAEDEHWNAMFAELEQFKKDNGNCNVSTTPPHTELIKWVIGQRREYKKLKENKESLLTASRLMRLNDIGFQFRQRADYTSWSDRINQLREYKNCHGHLKIPVSDSELGWFVSSQREEYRKRCDGKPSSLTDERYNDLNNLGFIFVGGKRKGAIKAPRKTWEERYQELVAFKNAHGHACVPQHFPGLGYWVHSQRNQYRMMKQGKKSPMTNEKALKLTELGMVWDAQKKRGSSTALITTASQHPASNAVPAVAAIARANGGMLPEDDFDDEEYHSVDMAGV